MYRAVIPAKAGIQYAGLIAVECLSDERTGFPHARDNQRLGERCLLA